MWTAFPSSDYYEDSVTIGVSPRRPSCVSLGAWGMTLLKCHHDTISLFAAFCGVGWHLGRCRVRRREWVADGCRDLRTATPIVVIPVVTKARLHGPVGVGDGDPGQGEPTGPRGPQRGSAPSSDGVLPDCGDFVTWREANEHFIASGGPEKDPYGMDSDGDGIPCETLREQKPDG